MICVSASLKYFLYVRSFVVGLTYKTSHSFNHSSYFNRNTSEIIFFAVFHSVKTAKTVPHRSGYPDALKEICFHLKVCYSVVIFVFLPSRFQTRVCLLRFQTISVLPAIMPGQANLSRNPEFPLCFFVSLTLSDSFTSSFVRQYRTAPCVASACKFSPYCIKIPCNTSVFLRHFYAIFRKICLRTCRTSSARYCLNFSAHAFLRKNGKNTLCNYTQFRAVLLCLHLRENRPIFDK